MKLFRSKWNIQENVQPPEEKNLAFEHPKVAKNTYTVPMTTCAATAAIKLGAMIAAVNMIHQNSRHDLGEVGSPGFSLKAAWTKKIEFQGMTWKPMLLSYLTPKKEDSNEKVKNEIPGPWDFFGKPAVVMQLTCHTSDPLPGFGHRKKHLEGHPVSKYLVIPTCKPFRLFGRGNNPS